MATPAAINLTDLYSGHLNCETMVFLCHSTQMMVVFIVHSFVSVNDYCKIFLWLISIFVNHLAFYWAESDHLHTTSSLFSAPKEMVGVHLGCLIPLANHLYSREGLRLQPCLVPTSAGKFWVYPSFILTLPVTLLYILNINSMNFVLALILYNLYYSPSLQTVLNANFKSTKQIFKWDLLCLAWSNKVFRTYMWSVVLSPGLNPAWCGLMILLISKNWMNRLLIVFVSNFPRQEEIVITL